MSGADRWAEVGGLRVRYRDEGAGPALVLVHGVGSRLDSWNGVVDALGGRWRTIRMDLRGHGRSDKPAGPYSLYDFTGDIAGLLDVVGVERCHLAGFSLGGLIAQGFALRHPERLDRLVLLSTVAGRNEEERQKVAARLDMVASGIAGDHFRNSVSRWFTEAWIAANPEAIARAEAENKENDPAAYAAAYRVLATNDLADRLHEITAPTLVATGEFDLGSNTRMAHLMHERIRGSRLHVFLGMKHSILAEIPQEIAARIEAFLAEPR
ncbi:MAG: alpha/beta fold hydrolase [Alphaproteobacteria bacterium]|nr:alpha/beta fold hydrolase [Alphaproteobacteria bacterium]